METDVVIFWFVVFSCVSGAAATFSRLRSAGRGWIVVYLGILSAAVIGWTTGRSVLVYTAFATWLLLVLLPSLLSSVCHQSMLRQRFSTARRAARIVGWLHPADGWRRIPEIMGALEAAQRGEFAAATKNLGRLQETKSQAGLVAIATLYRLNNQWEELLVWNREAMLERHANLLPVLLRAHGETGELRALVQLFDRNKTRIARMVPRASRDMCRLMLFAFCGRRESVERLMAGTLSVLPTSGREFWLATTDLASGKTEAARRRLEEMLQAADPPMRLSIGWRLSRTAALASSLDASGLQIVEEAAREHDHDENFGSNRSVFSRRARATQVLIILNVLVFVGETALGGSGNGETLYRLGALWPPAVRAGEWWRLVASLFLHFGALHLSMNMFALGVLGPFVEYALGFRRYLLVYLIAGVGSMGTVMLIGSGPLGEQITVGASGSVMGLVGALGALMLRGWLRVKASSAKRRLTGVLMIVVMQTVFDSLIPHVSMTAHLSGTVIGFVVAMAFRDRLETRSAARD